MTRVLKFIHRHAGMLAILVPSIVILVFLVGYPIGILFMKTFVTKQGYFTLQNFIKVFTESGLYTALFNSFYMAGWVTFLSLLIGLPMAWAVARTDMPGKTLIIGMVTVCFVVPSFVGAIAWILLLGENVGKLNVLARQILPIKHIMNIFSMKGLIFVLTLHLFPFVFLNAKSALDNMDPAYEDGAAMSGSNPFKTVIHITLPIIKPAIFTGGMLVFLSALASFGAPAALALPAGFNTLTTKIFTLFAYPPRFELAAACVLPLIATTGFLLWLQSKVLGRAKYTTLTGKLGRPQAVQLGKARYFTSGFCWAVLGVAFFLPVGMLAMSSFTIHWGYPLTVENFTINNYKILFDTTSYIPRSIRNSFILGLGTATICVMLTLAVAYVVERTHIVGKPVLEFLSMVTFAFPAMALGVGVALGFMRPPLLLYGTLWILLVGYISKRISYSFVLIRNSLKQIDPELEEAARVSGASWIQAFKGVNLPLLKTGMTVAWILIFAVCLRELSMSILLFLPGTETMAVSIYLALDDGFLEKAATVSCLLVALSISSVFVTKKLTGKGVLEV